MTPRVSIVVPVYNEGPAIVRCLDRVVEGVRIPCEILTVYDSPQDTTVPHVRAYAQRVPFVVPLLNTYGPGPANAIRSGFDRATAPVVVVTMADGSDDPMQIEQLTRLVERGVVIACASRYMKGGQQVGGPWLKGKASRAAGLTMRWFGRVGTHDATNSFKAYSRRFVTEVGIESDAGFEIGIELVAKARRRRLPVAEIPTIWLDRDFGASNFKVRQWVPRYLRWYAHGLDPRRCQDRVAGLTGHAVAPAAEDDLMGRAETPIEVLR
ncbi:MAG TPA: glycosyltransferase family 2 protein [Candidatus Dormibacteraeota bacterium]|nr:glycosyltransferase family 2 protein [Candidatus Dormibacteraeota bacterium]